MLILGYCGYMVKLIKIIAFSCWIFFSIPFCSASENSSSAALIKIDPARADRNIDLKVKSDTYPLTKNEMAGWVEEKSSLDFNKEYLSEIETTDVCAYAKSIACSLLMDARDNLHWQKSSDFFLNTESVKKYVENLSQKINKDPVNATLNMQDGKVSVFSLEQKGIALDNAASTDLLIRYLAGDNQSGSLELVFSEKDPAVSIDSIDNLGITSLIGEGHSNFRGSPKNRIFNIKVASAKFDDVLIKPGEEFSFVGALGPVDGEHGYLPELVIKKDKTEPEFGGGICQVSTTAFRAAIYSGLPITARRNHAYPVSYYNPQGMDSTVYIPKPDLRFINNTPSYILIQTEISGTELIFRFFGTDDGRKTAVDGPHILEKKPDGSMKTTFTQKVVDASGNVVREDVFNSSYDSPSKYPHPGAAPTQKPDDWSKKQWDAYLKDTKKP
jgi:vancomycin resistance protein YoaR